MVSNLVDDIRNDDLVSAKISFNNAMANIVKDTIDNLKQEVGSKIHEPKREEEP
jgi:hypothetical protein